MDFWIKAAQLMLSLAILVTLHEFGHFIPARLFKIRVEKFYLFFDPWFSLFKKKIGDTEWGIGWLPLGGYVKIAGMVDESMDKDQLAAEPKEDEFRSKPAWQRLVVMIGGVVTNVIVGFIIYIFVVFGYGENIIKNDSLSYGMAVSPVMTDINPELKDGIKVLSVDGVEVVDVNDVWMDIWTWGGRTLEIETTSGEKKTVVLPEEVEGTSLSKHLFQNDGVMSFKPRQMIFLDSVTSNKDTLRKGDQLIAINGENTTFYHEFTRAVKGFKDTTSQVTLVRGGDTIQETISIDGDGKIGFYVANEGQFEVSHIDYSFGESVSRGFNKAGSTMYEYVYQLQFIFTSKGASSLGGFGAIGGMFGDSWDWQRFWSNTAFLSLVLAIMNILPIPALDGGHVVFLLYEMITGREAPQKVLEYAQIAGIVLLLGLMLYANGNDIYKWITG